MAQTKKPIGSTQPLREHVTVQIEIGRADAILRAARAFVFEALDALWEAGAKGEVSIQDRLRARMAGSHAAAAAVEVVNMMFAAAGAGGIHERGRLARSGGTPIRCRITRGSRGSSYRSAGAS